MAQRATSVEVLWILIIRPTERKGIAKGVVKFLTDMGLFIGQSPASFDFLNDLPEDADEARRGR